MNFSVRNTLKKTFAILMIGIVGLLIVNRGLFLHSHKLENGSVVIHSHPYNKSQDSEPFKKHHHTKAEFIFFEKLNVLFFLIILILTYLLLIRGKIFFVYVEKIYSSLISFSYQGRAPPIL